jgi:hypothetical protein
MFGSRLRTPKHAQRLTDQLTNKRAWLGFYAPQHDAGGIGSGHGKMEYQGAITASANSLLKLFGQLDPYPFRKVDSSDLPIPLQYLKADSELIRSAGIKRQSHVRISKAVVCRQK